MFLTCRAVLGAGRMTVPDHGAARRAPVSYSPRYSQSSYKTISSSGQSLALYLTDFWGLQPALPLLVHFSGISTPSLSGRELIRRFETVPPPHQAWLLLPEQDLPHSRDWWDLWQEYRGWHGFCLPSPFQILQQ